MDQAGALERFIDAQEPVFARALEEIRRGAKRSHWMWFIFPQLSGLGRSATAQLYAIASLEEARAYLEHPILGARYIACVEALQDLGSSDPVPVFGETDAKKLQSSLTLFEAAGAKPLISAALDRWFAGKRDEKTLKLLAATAIEPSPT
ncbi:uncharacterized protein (DUF1810 family) [Sphingopyxis sp. OAS728]|uniref:DUF1810 domain-containing protein n=1 Tax=Sphingopyxis sp. OAS728 TaxID=2663823 RepID=UPI00178B7D84|nr:DUF1810 domain-containing protein [Sphingopyxis sp. OAS728]MBE1529820.1 uncharacterized protein (DUF1810 family) [Sphingopyxis sp. OAS728]